MQLLSYGQSSVLSQPTGLGGGVGIAGGRGIGGSGGRVVGSSAMGDCGVEDGPGMA